MLTIENLTVHYGDRPVLKDVSLEVRSGEVLALIGPNGAGKSTLIRAVSGVVPIRSGAVRVDGAGVTAMPPMERARRISVVPQAVSLPPAFSVWEAVLLGRTPYLNFLGQASPADEALVRRALEQVDLLRLRDSRMDELSGGEQQRVLLARALAQAAPILLMDEPTSHLDLRHQIDLLKLIAAQARQAGLTVLVALHDLNLASLFADRMAVIEDGRVCLSGSPVDTITAEMLRSVYRLPVYILPHPGSGAPLVIPEVS